MNDKASTLLSKEYKYDILNNHNDEIHHYIDSRWNFTARRLTLTYQFRLETSIGRKCCNTKQRFVFICCSTQYHTLRPGK